MEKIKPDKTRLSVDDWPQDSSGEIRNFFKISPKSSIIDPVNFLMVDHMGTRDKEIIETLIDRAIPIRTALLTQKELEGYLGLEPKQLSEKIRNKKNHLTFDVLLDLINTLHTYKVGSFQKKLAKEVATIYEEMAFKSLPKEIRESMVQSMSRWNIYNFISESTEIIWFPSDADFQNDLLQLFSSEKKCPNIALLTNNQHIHTVIQSIETWAYGSRGNYKDDLSLTAYTQHAANTFEIIGCITDDNFYGFAQDSKEGAFRLMTGLESAQIWQHHQGLSDLKPVWRLLRTANARKIERFVRGVPKDWYPEIVGFLRSKIINIEEAEQIHASYDDKDFFAVIKEEISEALGEDLGRRFSNRLVMHLAGLESAST